jgi:tRNA uridine 5-carbamoylmethylation protein Kti12
MAAAIESKKTGGKYGHMYIILTEEEYRLATKDTSANVDMLQKPDKVNPKFKTTKEEDLTRYMIMQLENETKAVTIAYITQEEVSKEITRQMVDSIELEFIKELKHEYTGFTNQTPRSFIAHIEKEFCEPTINDQLKAVQELKKPWDQVVPIGTWITRVEQQRQKCTEAAVNIDNKAWYY